MDHSSSASWLRWQVSSIWRWTALVAWIVHGTSLKLCWISVVAHYSKLFFIVKGFHSSYQWILLLIILCCSYTEEMKRALWAHSIEWYISLLYCYAWLLLLLLIKVKRSDSLVICDIGKCWVLDYSSSITSLIYESVATNVKLLIHSTLASHIVVCLWH